MTEKIDRTTPKYGPFCSSHHHLINIRIIPHIECRGGARTYRYAENCNHTNQRVDGAWSHYHADASGKDNKLHHPRLHKLVVVAWHCRRDELVLFNALYALHAHFSLT